MRKPWLIGWLPNIGYGKDGGIFYDSTELLATTVESKEYKGVKLKKIYMDAAINLLADRYTKDNYATLTHNCQYFVEDSIRLANELASLYGDTVFMD